MSTSSLPVVNEQGGTSQQVTVSHGSIGGVVGVLVVIIILGALAVMVGRLCSGKRVMGYGHFDLETWAQTKCSSCIDGTSVSLPLPVVSTSTSSVQTH